MRQWVPSPSAGALARERVPSMEQSVQLRAVPKELRTEHLWASQMAQDAVPSSVVSVLCYQGIS